MNREEIKKILPHRGNMLLLDSVYSQDGTAFGQYTFKGDEWFFNGHFPDEAVVPGVILCEIMAQTVSVLLAESYPSGAGVYLTGLDRVRFKNPVRPGDILDTRCFITNSKKNFYFASGKGYVGNALCVNGNFSFAVRPR